MDDDGTCSTSNPRQARKPFRRLNSARALPDVMDPRFIGWEMDRHETCENNKVVIQALVENGRRLMKSQQYGFHENLANMCMTHARDSRVDHSSSRTRRIKPGTSCLPDIDGKVRPSSHIPPCLEYKVSLRIWKNPAHTLWG